MDTRVAHPGISPDAISPHVITGAYCEGFSIVREGNRYPITNTNLADLIQSNSVIDILSAHQGEDFHLSSITFSQRQPDRESIAIGSDIHSNSKTLINGIAEDGLAESLPARPFSVDSIDRHLTRPLLLRGAPMATVDPSADRATDFPEKSPAASPLISCPIFCQLVPSLTSIVT